MSESDNASLGASTKDAIVHRLHIEYVTDLREYHYISYDIAKIAFQ